MRVRTQGWSSGSGDGGSPGLPEGQGSPLNINQAGQLHFYFIFIQDLTSPKE